MSGLFDDEIRKNIRCPLVHLQCLELTVYGREPPTYMRYGTSIRIWIS